MKLLQIKYLKLAQNISFKQIKKEKKKEKNYLKPFNG